MASNDKKYIPPHSVKRGFGKKWKRIPSQVCEQQNFKMDQRKNIRKNNYKEENKITFKHSEIHENRIPNKSFIERRRNLRKKEYIAEKIIKTNDIVEKKQIKEKEISKKNTFKSIKTTEKMVFSTSSFTPYVNNKSESLSSDYFNIPKDKEEPLDEQEKNYILNYVNNMSDSEDGEQDNTEL